MASSVTKPARKKLAWMLALLVTCAGLIGISVATSVGAGVGGLPRGVGVIAGTAQEDAQAELTLERCAWGGARRVKVSRHRTPRRHARHKQVGALRERQSAQSLGGFAYDGAQMSGELGTDGTERLMKSIEHRGSGREGR